jgi:hypothetical protein
MEKKAKGGSHESRKHNVNAYNAKQKFFIGYNERVPKEIRLFINRTFKRFKLDVAVSKVEDALVGQSEIMVNWYKANLPRLVQMNQDYKHKHSPNVKVGSVL